MSLQRSVGWASPSTPARWIERFARLGIATKGMVYILVGGIAVMAAAGSGHVTGSEGAVRSVGEQPLGQVLLVLSAAGMFGYALWRLIEAYKNPERAHALRRLGNAISGVAHIVLGVAVLQIIDGGGGGNGDRRTLTDLLSGDAGRLLVGIAGVGIVIAAVAQVIKAKKAEFTRRLSMGAMTSSERDLVLRLGRMGLTARGVVLAIVGYFLTRAALHANAAEAHGLGGALREVASGPFGMIALVVVALGLAAYGGFMLFAARYRQIRCL